MPLKCFVLYFLTDELFGDKSTLRPFLHYWFSEPSRVIQLVLCQQGDCWGKKIDQTCTHVMCRMILNCPSLFRQLAEHLKMSK